jgi:GNAT superfamily N-acetyltransferase
MPMMILPVDQNNIKEAAAVHAASWQDSHRAFCSADFVALHSPERQEQYMLQKMSEGSRFFLLKDPLPLAVVSVRDNLIEDLYVLPEAQGKGYGTALLRYAVSQCTGIPTLWILENNERAAALYRRIGFSETGRRSTVTRGLDEVEFSIVSRPAEYQQDFYSGLAMLPKDFLSEGRPEETPNHWTSLSND